MNEEEKGKIEIKVFEKFIKESNLDINEETIEKNNPPLPDIRCEYNDNRLVWFELTEACTPRVKQAINDPPENGISVFFGKNSVKETIQNKMGKEYSVNEPVELLIYTNGAIGIPDNMIITNINEVISNNRSQFERIWFFGDSLEQLYP